MIIKRPAIVVAVLCLVYVAVRMWRLTDSCLWFDEIFSVHAAEHSWSGMWWFVAQDLIHPPLFYALLKVWIGIGGDSLLWLRLFPVLVSILALIPFVYLCRELRLRASAMLIALLLFAVSGSLIKYAQEVRMYSLLLCLSLFSIWLFARFFYRGKNIWILIAVNVLLVHTHYFGWLVIASEVLIILIMQRVKVRHVLVMAGIVAVSFVPWLVAVMRAASGGSDIEQNIGWIGRPGIMELLDLIFDLVEPFYFQMSNADPRTILWASLPMIAVLVIAKLAYLSENDTHRERLLILAVFIALPILSALLVSWMSPYSVWGSRHLVMIFAPAAILFAIFLSEIRSAALRNTLFAGLGVVILAAFVRTTVSPPQEQIWCGWEKAREVEVDRKDGMIYAFEDLAAYHLWFATRRSDVEITKVNGVEGIVEDKAYFLPRGSDDAVRVIGAADVPEAADMNGREVHFAFRDTSWNDHHQPIAFFKQKGYKVRQAFASEPVQGMRVFLGEASR